MRETENARAKQLGQMGWREEMKSQKHKFLQQQGRKGEEKKEGNGEIVIQDNYAR